jgi:hypothetical protein
MLSGGTRQDSEIKPASKGHSLSVECRGRLITSAKESQRARGTHGLSSAGGEIHQDSERKPETAGKRTSCRAQSEFVIKIAEERERARSTDSLSSAERWACQDSKRKTTGDVHSQTVKQRGRDKSGQRNEASGGGALTSCRTKSERLIRTAKESLQIRRNSRPVERRARVSSGQ